MNISASLNVFRLITNPALCLPQATIPTFNHLPIPVSEAFSTGRKGEKPDIRAIVLDKDNCFARKGENVVWEAYEVGVLFGLKVFSALIYYCDQSYMLLSPVCDV